MAIFPHANVLFVVGKRLPMAVKMNLYSEMKNRHTKEINEFPIVFAFCNKQFIEEMKKLGLKPDETDKVYKFGDTGGFYRRSDAKSLHDMLDRHKKELQDLINGDTTGDYFIFDMFNYELSNHEYCITWDVSDALDALGLSMEAVNADARLLHGLTKACNAQKDY